MKKKEKMKKAMVVLGLLVLTSLILAGCGKKDSGEVEDREEETSERYKEEKLVRFPTPIPGKEEPVPKAVFSRGVFQISNFSVELTSVVRELNRTNLDFAITKIKDIDAKIESMPLILDDDHQNKYYGRFDILPYDNFPLEMLPTGFTYIKTISITMPKMAPIETIQIAEIEAVSFKKIKLTKPEFKSNLGKSILKIGESVSVGKFLFFTVDSIVPDFYTWAIETTIENKDYNPLRGEIQCAVQLVDGRIVVPETPAVETISGSSKKKTQIKLDSLRGETTPEPRMLLVFYQSLSEQEKALKLLPISKRDLPPRVGQGTNERVFIEAYQLNGGRQVLGDPLDLPRWYAGGAQPKDGRDLLVQEFSENTKIGKSCIFWDKQNNTPAAYVLHGNILDKYQELGGPYYRSEIQENLFLGPPTSNLEACKSAFGTTGSFAAFKAGVIFLRDNQTFLVMGKIGEKWNEQSEQLGFPLDEPQFVDIAGKNGRDVSDYNIWVQQFQGGWICYVRSIAQRKTSIACIFHKAILEKYLELVDIHLAPARENDFSFIWPINDEKSCQSSFNARKSCFAFEGGTITFSEDEIVVIEGDIFERWQKERAEKGDLGFPIKEAKKVNSGTQDSSAVGWSQKFEGGSLVWIIDGEQAGKTYIITGPVAETYYRMGAEASQLGFPITDIYKSFGSNSADQTEFEAGYIGTRDGKRWEIFSYDSGQIVFVSNRGGNKEIYVMDASGKNQTNLTNHPADDWGPVWSPDGTKIAFASNRDGKEGIYLMNAEGTGQRFLTNGKDPSWFPGGERIVFSAASAQQHHRDRVVSDIYAINISGANRSLLWESRLDSIQPVVSPDGNFIVFTEVDRAPYGLVPGLVITSLEEITAPVIMDRRGSRAQRKQSAKLYNRGGAASWSSSGNLIVFQRYDRSGGIWLIDFSEWTPSPFDARATELTNFGNNPCFSPDGQKIAFSFQGEFYIIDVAGFLGRKIIKDPDGANSGLSWRTVK